MKAIAQFMLMNSTELQNPQRKLCGKCLWLSYVFGSVFACAKSAHVSEPLTRFADFVSNNFPQTVRFFCVSLCSQGPQQQYTVNFMHYSVTLWAYLLKFS